MYCLPHFCFLCFRNKKLKNSHEISFKNTLFLDAVKVVIPESEFFDLSRFLLACEDCVRTIEEMYAFRQTSIANNRLWVEYVKQLRSFGGEIGNVEIKIVDMIENPCRNVLIKTEIGIKEERPEDGLHDYDFVDMCNFTQPEAIDNPIETYASQSISVQDPIEVSCKLESLDDEEIKTEIEKKQKSDEINHTSVHTEKKQYRCKICDHSFTKKTNLNQHELTHTGENPYQCKTCEKTFTNLYNLKQHNGVHTGEKPYKCELCGKSFLRNSYLREHIIFHSGQRSHKCNICEKSFYTFSKLNRHKRIHSDYKPYTCDTCGISFSDASTFKRHHLVHSNEKPHKCDICGKAFIQLTNLKQHKLIHTGEKPHRCELCQKSFSRLSYLKEHILMHNLRKKSQI